MLNEYRTCAALMLDVVGDDVSHFRSETRGGWAVLQRENLDGQSMVIRDAAT